MRELIKKQFFLLYHMAMNTFLSERSVSMLIPELSTRNNNLTAALDGKYISRHLLSEKRGGRTVMSEYYSITEKGVFYLFDLAHRRNLSADDEGGWMSLIYLPEGIRIRVIPKGWSGGKESVIQNHLRMTETNIFNYCSVYTCTGVRSSYRPVSPYPAENYWEDLISGNGAEDMDNDEELIRFAELFARKDPLLSAVRFSGTGSGDEERVPGGKRQALSLYKLLCFGCVVSERMRNGKDRENRNENITFTDSRRIKTRMFELTGSKGYRINGEYSGMVHTEERTAMTFANRRGYYWEPWKVRISVNACTGYAKSAAMYENVSGKIDCAVALVESASAFRRIISDADSVIIHGKRSKEEKPWTGKGFREFVFFRTGREGYRNYWSYMHTKDSGAEMIRIGLEAGNDGRLIRRNENGVYASAFPMEFFAEDEGRWYPMAAGIFIDAVCIHNLIRYDSEIKRQRSVRAERERTEGRISDEELEMKYGRPVLRMEYPKFMVLCEKWQIPYYSSVLENMNAVICG